MFAPNHVTVKGNRAAFMTSGNCLTPHLRVAVSGSKWTAERKLHLFGTTHRKFKDPDVHIYYKHCHKTIC